MKTRVKFCGCTSVHDVDLAVQCGADAVGFIFADSARRISLQTLAEMAPLLPRSMTPVGVFVDPTREEVARARLIVPQLVVQLSGGENPELCASIGSSVIKAIHVGLQTTIEQLEATARSFARELLMFDTQAAVAGGSGKTFAWTKVTSLARQRPVIISGGLTPDNVAECVRLVRPYGVDVRSGVETDGRKDLQKMRSFADCVRHAHET